MSSTPALAQAPVTSAPNHDEKKKLLISRPSVNELIELWEKNQTWKDPEITAYLMEKAAETRR